MDRSFFNIKNEAGIAVLLSTGDVIGVQKVFSKGEDFEFQLIDSKYKDKFKAFDKPVMVSANDQQICRVSHKEIVAVLELTEMKNENM